MEARSNPSWSESAHGVEYEQFKYWLLTLYSLAPYMSCIKRCMLLTQTAKIVRLVIASYIFHAIFYGCLTSFLMILHDEEWRGIR